MRFLFAEDVHASLCTLMNSIDCLMKLPMKEQDRLETIADQLRLVLCYIKRESPLNPRQQNEAIDEIMGVRELNRLAKMEKKLGPHGSKVAEDQIMMRMNANDFVCEDVCYEAPLMCGEVNEGYNLRSDNGFMRQALDRFINADDYKALFAIDMLLEEYENEWAGFSEMRVLINEKMMEHFANKKKSRIKVNKDDFREALMDLFEAKDYSDQPLFRKNNHWVAVMRIAIDEKLVEDNSPEDFVRFVNGLNLPSMPRPLNRKTIGNSYNGIYTKQLDEWTETNYNRMMVEDGKGRKGYFFQMRSVALKLRDLLRCLCQRHK